MDFSFSQLVTLNNALFGGGGIAVGITAILGSIVYRKKRNNGKATNECPDPGCKATLGGEIQATRNDIQRIEVHLSTDIWGAIDVIREGLSHTQVGIGKLIGYEAGRSGKAIDWEPKELVLKRKHK